MRPAISALILARIAASGSEFAAAQAVNDRQAAETTGPRTESSEASAKATAEPADAVGSTERGCSNVGPVRWMAPEALD